MGVVLNHEQVKEIIPHRDPMLLIDEVHHLIPGKEVKGTFHVEGSRQIFKGHFPENPVLPGVYTVECMAQASDILLLSTERYRGKIPFFIAINNVSFKKMIKPGDTIEIHAKMMSENEGKAIVTCKVSVFLNESLAAEGEVTLAMR